MSEAGDVSCPLCGGCARAVWRRYPGYQAPRRYTLTYCGACDASFAVPLEVPPRLYEHIYRQSRGVPGYWRYAEYAARVRFVPDPLSYLAASEDVYWAVQELLANVPHDARILEIGSGFGYLTYAIHRRGYHVVGLDISQVAATQARERYGDLFVCADVHDFAARERQRFDLVVMTEVLEHLTDPRAFLASVAALLRPAGRLLLTTPNKTAYVPNAVWNADAPPVHLWWFSERAMERLAASLALSIQFVDFTAYNEAVAEMRLAPLRPQVNRSPLLTPDGTLISTPRSLPVRAVRKLLGLNRQRSTDGLPFAGSAFTADAAAHRGRRETMAAVLSWPQGAIAAGTA